MEDWNRGLLVESLYWVYVKYATSAKADIKTRPDAIILSSGGQASKAQTTFNQLPALLLGTTKRHLRRTPRLLVWNVDLAPTLTPISTCATTSTMNMFAEADPDPDPENPPKYAPPEAHRDTRPIRHILSTKR